MTAVTQLFGIHDAQMTGTMQIELATSQLGKNGFHYCDARLRHVKGSVCSDLELKLERPTSSYNATDTSNISSTSL